MPKVELNGATIHFEDTGGDGEPIIFSHGLLFSGAMFESQVKHFRNGFAASRVITGGKDKAV